MTSSTPPPEGQHIRRPLTRRTLIASAGTAAAAVPAAALLGRPRRPRRSAGRDRAGPAAGEGPRDP